MAAETEGAWRAPDTNTPGPIEVRVPTLEVEVVARERNSARHLMVPSGSASLEVAGDGTASVALASGERVAVVIGRPRRGGTAGLSLSTTRAGLAAAAASGVLSEATWVGTPPVAPDGDEVVASWLDRFQPVAEDVARGRPGLRPPQLGALYALLAHWSTQSTEPATIVMPTATGKTETMLALLCAERIQHLLVVVPSDALRDQTVKKFLSLGILPVAGVVGPGTLRPIVGSLEHGFDSTASAAEFAAACNVIVSTPNALTASTPEARDAIASTCTTLFVDEAHHVAAATWSEVRDLFRGKRTVQFTATPFREDGRHLGGRVVYAYPLALAQAGGYFAPIDFVSVLDLGDHDRAIATKAVERLRADVASGFDHLMMARVRAMTRAGPVHALYSEIAADLAPVILHSGLPQRARREAINAIRERRSRVIVCVNMLGEGFDLPALKVAAIHDPHRSLGVTLQFIGRFARTTGTALGTATAVVGRPGGEMDPHLRRLYSEDANWNLLIRDLSATAVDAATGLGDFEAAFGSKPDGISMRSLLPKMSTVVYRTTVDPWAVEGIAIVHPDESLLFTPVAVNERDRVAWFVAEVRTPVQWGEFETVEEVAYHLYVLHWDADRKLLFINSSNNDSYHEDLAEAVGGPGTRRITGDGVYRAMASIDRLVPTSVGLLDVRNRSRRFSMHVGADVTEGFPVVEAATKTKTNIFAYGFEAGERVSIGASVKGRIWSHSVAASLKQWVEWCGHVGGKLLDDGLDVDEIFKNFIRPESLDSRPELVPLALEWPWEVQAGSSERLLDINGNKTPFVDADLLLLAYERTGSIPFAVRGGAEQVAYSLDIVDGSMRFIPASDEAFVESTRRRVPLSEFLARTGLLIHLEQEAVIQPPAFLLRPVRELEPFDPAKLSALDWTDIDLQVESQGPARRPDSIQARMIAHVRTLGPWDVVIDDDGAGEVADIVAARESGGELQVLLTHCKWVSGGIPRAQIVDLYEVCGQAQRSVASRRAPSHMLERLLRRAKYRVDHGRPSGYMDGDHAALARLADRCLFLRPSFTIAIAQPGLSAAAVSPSQLELLASTETYVMEAGSARLEVYCSP
jgi:superfamily II DNA or RNA helicase